MTELNVYVPAHDSTLGQHLAPGSAIVGSKGHRGKILIDFEGNLYGSTQMEPYAAKLRHAAGRHIEKYPTVARMMVARQELIWVGTYDYETDSLVVVNRNELNEWSKASEYR